MGENGEKTVRIASESLWSILKENVDIIFWQQKINIMIVIVKFRN